MKHKTKQAARKRFQVSAKGKVQRRRVKQSHFNARATGDETRRKHRDEPVAASDRGHIERLIPNHL